MAVAVKQDDKAPVPVEILAQAIVRISDGVLKLRKSGVNERAIIVLLHDAIPVGSKFKHNERPTKKQIKAVLTALTELKKLYTTT